MRSSGGTSSKASARPAPAAKSSVSRASSRSMPLGSGPRAITPTLTASATGIRLAATLTLPSSYPAGCRPSSGRGLSTTRTVPRACNSASKSSRPGWARPSDSHIVSNRPSGKAPTQSAKAGAQACGCNPAARPDQASAVWNSTASGASVSRISATGRPEAPASATSASAFSTRRGQSRASAQLPSTTISIGPDPATRTSGFRIGPAKPMIAAATASIRNKSSHHGVLSVSASSSLRPRSRATPGNRRRIGAGGTARSRIHRIGSAISASRSSGVAKPTGPTMNIYRPPCNAA